MKILFYLKSEKGDGGTNKWKVPESQGKRAHSKGMWKPLEVRKGKKMDPYLETLWTSNY